jgi:predicted ArsR family transcriptional regulator
MHEGTRNLASPRAMTRREVLRALTALTVAGVVPAARAQGALPAAQFVALSKAVAGYAYADKRVAAAMLTALASAVGAANLTRLAKLASSTPAEQLGPALAAANLEAIAETVVAALYTGTVNTPRGVRVISYDQALVWQALAWTKPNAFCGGETNYWAAPPSTS